MSEWVALIEWLSGWEREVSLNVMTLIESAYKHGTERH